MVKEEDDDFKILENSVHKKQSQKSMMDGHDLLAFMQPYIKNRSDSVLDIRAWAQEHFH